MPGLRPAAPELLAALITCANLLADYDEQDGEEGDAYRDAITVITAATSGKDGTMTAHDDDILDGLFHGCALAAFLDQADGRARLAFERGHPRPGLPLLRRRPGRTKGHGQE